MYLLDDMIEMGLKKGQKWPSPEHRLIACNVALCNPMVKDRGTLIEIVQKIRDIPQDKIKTVTFADLPSYGIGLFGGI